jgi:mRNA interferase MazF
MVIEQGDIWWANLPEPEGSEPGYRRPVVIVQSNEFNRSQIRTVVCVAVTSNLKLAEAPGNVRLNSTVTDLPRDSVANVSQVITLDRLFLTERVGQLPLDLLEGILDGVELVLGRSGYSTIE